MGAGGFAMFTRLALAFALFAAPFTAAAAEPTSTNPDPYSPDRKQVALDDDQARKFMDDFARCIARMQPRKAAAVLAMPYGSAQQRTAAWQLETTETDCLGPYSGSIELRADARPLVGGMAEYFLSNPGKLADTRRRDPQSFVYAEPVGVENFGDCVVALNPAAVEALAKSKVTTVAESVAADALVPELQQCVSSGRTLAFNRTELRHLLSVSLYKHLAMPAPAPAATAQAPANQPAHN